MAGKDTVTMPIDSKQKVGYQTKPKGKRPTKFIEKWKEEIRSLAPDKPTVKPSAKHKALLFDLMTGYQHGVTPFTSEVIKILGEKSGAYEVIQTTDVTMFEPDKIKQFDIIILNNNCSKKNKRDIFWDVTKDEKKAAALEKSLLDHIHGGKGLVALHGSIVMQNNSVEFSEMLGGSFDFHPAHQEVSCIPVDPDHPLVAAFNGEPFVHKDEPYLFKSAYEKKNFKPLLEMDTSKLSVGKQKARIQSDKRYVAWIKRYGQGRVFYCSPSHNMKSYDRPELLQFILDGIQYAAGDLKCDDSKMKNKE